LIFAAGAAQAESSRLPPRMDNRSRKEAVAIGTLIPQAPGYLRISITGWRRNPQEWVIVQNRAAAIGSG
jgi:hypothetical protein